MTFDGALEELGRAGDDDLPDVVRALLGMATFAALVGRPDQRDAAVRVAGSYWKGALSALAALHPTTDLRDTSSHVTNRRPLVHTVSGGNPQRAAAPARARAQIRG